MSTDPADSHDPVPRDRTRTPRPADHHGPVPRDRTRTPRPADPRTAADPPGWRRELRAFGELFALSGLAIAQPTFDLFGGAPDHLIFRGADRGDILAFALVITFAVPLLLWLVEFLVGLASDRVRTVLHRLSLWTLTAIFLTLLIDLRLDRIIALIAGGILAAGFVALHHRTAGPRIWLAFLSPAPIAFLAIFLLASPVAPLLRGPAGTIDASIGNPTRTFVLIFDEFSLSQILDEEGGIDADLFPNFADLAGTSTWFRQATTVANTTDAVVPSMLTGKLPSGRPAPTEATYPQNLFTLLGSQMPITAVEVVTRMCPESACERLDDPTGGLPNLLRDARDALTHRLDPADPDTDPITSMVEDEGENPDAAGPDDGEDGLPEGEDFAEALGAFVDGGAARLDRILDTVGPRPELHFLHLLLPHGPFRLLPDGRAYPAGERTPGRSIDKWFDDPTPVAFNRQRNLLQAQWADALLGHLRDRLETAGHWDDTNLIVLSDHGITFEPGAPYRYVHSSSFDEEQDDPVSIAPIIWVPFFVKTADQTEGRISDDPVRTVDLAPTIADLLDVDIPWEIDGRSALDGGSGSPDEVAMQINEATETIDRPGPLHRIDRRLGWERVLALNAAAFAPPGDGVTGSDRIYRVGPRPDLWGRPVPDGLRSITVTIEEASRADDFDPDDNRVPALFRAVSEDAEVGTDVAIAVNGTIWATTKVFDDGGTARIDAMLTPEAFRSGRNELTVHQLPSR